MQQKQKFNRVSRIRTQSEQNQLSLQKSIQNYNRSRLKSLFYIRSKNTQKYYKNHPYFQSIVQQKKQKSQSGNKKFGDRIVTTQYETKQPQQRKSLINQKRFKTQKDQFQSKDKYYNSTNQFVSYPTNYGLENTVKYIEEQSFLNKKTVFNKNKLFQAKNNQNSFQLKKIKRRYSLTYQITNSNGKNDEKNGKNNYMKNTAAYQSKFYDRAIKSKKTYYQEGNDQKRISIQEKIKNINSDSKQINESIVKSQSVKQSIGYNRNVIYNAPPKLQKKPSLAIRQPSSLQTRSASHPITIIYGKRIKSFQQIPQRQLTFDILPYLINTFLKCKIRYKEMTLKQYNIIKTYIIKTIQTKIKSVRYDIKDIINLSTIKGVIDFLEQFKNQQRDYEWVETMRYFFITKEEKVLEYQMNKIKDQVAKLISIKYDSEFGKKQLFIYNVETKTAVESFYDLMKGQKFIIGDQEDVFEQYQSIINQKLEQQSFQQKINRWKGITDTSKETQNQSQKVSPTKSTSKGNLEQGKLQQSRSKFVTTKRLGQQKFNSLFQKFKIRQKKRLRKSFSTNSNLILSKQSSVSFIDKSKLKKQTDIFQ